MRLLESQIEAAVVVFAEEAGWLRRKMKYINRRACPDSWFFKGGRVVIIEFKRKHKTPRPDQEREIARLRAAGLLVLVIDDIEEGKRIFAD